MIDRAVALIRMDPVFSGIMYNGQVVSSTFRQPGFVEGSTYHSAELRFQAKRRAPWN